EMRRVVKPGGLVVCLETSQQDTFVFRLAYFMYFKFMMPFFGKLFAKIYKEYSWLQESAREFPGKKELAGQFEEAGLKNVKYHSFTVGVAATNI
ncbi:class I SAM-dependent methyltransferase, partial [Bacillus vallismortis]|nr:class I SAM-dependent methyltransferase [Bacillus vallismortis]